MTEATGEATAERPPRKTLGAVVGENVRRLREERSLTQHELAQVWKRQGLKWARSKIAALEAGNRPRVDCAELVMMAAGLQATVAELFEGSGEVHLTPHPIIVDREWLRAAFNSTQMSLWFDAQMLPGPEREARDEHMRGVLDTVKPYPWDSPSEADGELARRLAVPTDVVVNAAINIFDGRTLTQERDRRVANLGQMPMSERMAHRGHVTRELATLVEDQISKDAGERDR
jgi:transcriptional regulator with XRE-family HTH domain